MIELSQSDYEIRYRVIGRSGDAEELLFSTAISYGAAESWLWDFAKADHGNKPLELKIEKAWIRTDELRMAREEIQYLKDHRCIKPLGETK